MPKFKKENPITEEMIYKDPFNYTLKIFHQFLEKKRQIRFTNRFIVQEISNLIKPLK